MEAYMHTLRLRVRDAAHSCWTIAFPSDRPSGVYSVYTCIINSSLLAWSFSVALSHRCEKMAGRWLYAGMAHCFINMFFGVLVVVLTRRQISGGIPEETSQWLVCFSNPLIIVYSLYLVWEIAWMIAVGQFSARNPHTICSSHLNVQVGFFVFYLLIGFVLFYGTFITERLRRPRWRRFAAMRYDYLDRTRNRYTARGNDGRTSLGGSGEPVDLDRAGMWTFDGTERTTIQDYASIVDDSTMAAGDGQARNSRAAGSCRQPGE
ncbi:hypothetical protein, conserved [Leishmania tarentolae]|uniref:Transmembrane protein n=1 Tax=Leishmania tarentolae TaxID=5689 RepID=A0A640KMH1_LEITA|nr:hypothetical protein, conserved [Leishmania tarentolae]